MNRQFEYKDAMDSLHYTDQQKALLAERAAQAAHQTEKRAHRPLLRTALIAACLTAALAVTAGATGVLKSAAEAFAPIFGGSAAQTEIIDRRRHPGRPLQCRHRLYHHPGRRHRLRLYGQ